MTTAPHKKPTLFCVGFGYTSSVFANQLQQQGWQIIGTTRSQEKAYQMQEMGIIPILWSSDHTTLVHSADLSDTITACIISVPPDEQGCPALQAFAGHLLNQSGSLRWVGYLSSNGVYGDHDGAWVDETTPANPSSQRGQRRVLAEEQWSTFGRQNKLPIKIFRLPGIYGPGRSALDTVRQGRARQIIKPGQVFNRMHVQDIAGALYASVNIQTDHTLFNLCDDAPSPPQDVTNYACKLLNVDPPPAISIEDADLSPMGKSFYNDNKRVRNDRMKTALDFQLRYPSYREGLDCIFKNEIKNAR